jgi:L-alanine-DL-glutamate epimerase-like enolase superfamily enzyme
MASPVKLTVAHESWPIAGSFTISRGSKTSAEVVHVTLESDGAVGHGECVPYARYEETIDGAMQDLEAARARYRSWLHARRCAGPFEASRRAQRARLRAVGP